MITVYKVTLVGYLVDEDFGGEHPVSPEGWTPQQIIEEMDPNIEKTVIAIDSIKSEYQQEIEDAVDAAIDSPRRDIPDDPPQYGVDICPVCNGHFSIYDPAEKGVRPWRHARCSGYQFDVDAVVTQCQE